MEASQSNLKKVLFPCLIESNDILNDWCLINQAMEKPIRKKMCPLTNVSQMGKTYLACHDDLIGIL